jgi:DNA/RNA-binding domain of Phe-tRNA-synthetase-like protein
MNDAIEGLKGRVRVDPAIGEKYPQARIAVVYGLGIANGPSDAPSDALLRDACERVAQVLGGQKAQSHLHLQAWRSVYQSFGAKPSKYLCSAEALIQRALKGAPPRINRLVDFYNAVSIANVLPVGGEDLDCLRGDLVLRIADGTQTFDISDAGGDQPMIVPAGEVVWADDAGVTCRRWNWRQGRRTRLTETSRNAYFVLEALSPPFAEADFERAVQAIAAGLTAFGAATIVTDRLR